MNKNNKKEEKIWMEIHQICGDCGRRIKVKIDLEKISLNDLIKLVKSYYKKYNMACNKCSEKKI